MPNLPSLMALPDGDHPNRKSAEAEHNRYDDLREGRGSGRVDSVVSLSRNLNETPIDGWVRVRGHG